MSNENQNASEMAGQNEPSKPNWRPLSAFQRRVVGVLIEKAKTTPDNYPLTLNSIVTACNQKSNRSPLMDIASDDVLLTLDELREIGVVVELHGSGRVERFRHKAYEWFGVNKVELAVLAELLLRGEQTIGELRGRAARMEPIADLGELRPILDGLIERKLVIPLTPPGRGQVVTHGIFPPNELDQIKKQVSVSASNDVPRSDGKRPSVGSASPPNDDAIARLQNQVNQLTSRIELIEKELGL